MNKRVQSLVVSVALVGGLTTAVVPATILATSRPAAAATAVTWTQQHPATTPPALSSPAMAYDANTNQLLLTGAIGADTQDETWVWTGTTWNRLTPASSPPPLVAASMAYDALTGDLLLFGGQNSANALAPSNQTWLWNGSSWATYGGAGPSARAFASMAYDSHLQQIVLYGGTPDNGATVDNDSWIWSSLGWTPDAAPNAIPAGLWSAQVGYDSYKSTLVLHGGFSQNGGQQFDNFYAWNDATGNWDYWYNLPGPFCASCGNSLTTPGAVGGAGMTYDASLDQLIEFGGSRGGSLSSTTFDYVADNLVTPTASPPARTSPAMAYDGATGEIVLFGGNNGSANVSDTWVYGQPLPTPGAIRLFYAAPNGTAINVAGLIDDPSFPNFSYSLEIDSTTSCASSGGPYGPPNITVTSDANGIAYFTDTFPITGLAPIDLQLKSGGPFELSNCYPVGPDNTGWENAVNIPLVGGGGTTSGQIALPGESRWYKFEGTPDSKATVTLSGLSQDDAVAVYNDISQADTGTSGGVASLNTLSAESSADTFSPSAFIPSAFIPSAFIPSAFIPSAFIPSAFIPSAFIPSAFIPSAFIPSAFIPSAFIPSTYSGSVNRSLITFNDQGGTADKSVTVNTWTSTGSFYIRVAGRNGASDLNSSFQISVNAGAGACSSTVLPVGSPPVAAPSSGAQTVIFTDSSRVTTSPAERADLQAQLQALAARPEVSGAVVDLATNSRVQTLDAQADANAGCPYAKNLVANAVRDVVNSYRVNNPLKFVVIAGPDNVVPFFRHPDQTLIGNESGYTPPVADSSASQASLRLSYTLTDNDYGSNTVLQSQTGTLPVPDLAVGRLVETEPEISGQIQAYLGNTGGVLPTPASSLVTGYDFLTLPATSVQSDLAAGIGQAPDTLIAPRTQAPAGSWTGTDLKNKVLNSGRHDVVFLAGHFSANDTLAADYTTDMVTSDMEQSGVNLKNSLVFSAGCHSGYNIVNGDAVPNVTLTLDWPEEFARKQAVLIGGTGYQYGDTDFIAYSEQIDADFAHLLRVGTGPVSLGQALLKAKQDYLTNTPQLGAIGQKAVYEAELYGLPMESINMPTGRVPVPNDISTVSSTTPVTTDPGHTLGVSAADVSVNPTLTANTVGLQDLTTSGASVSASYLSGDNGIVTNPYQPVLPLESSNVSVPGQSLRGALFLGGSYTDTHGVTPLTGAPATEIRGVHTGFTSSVFFPEKPWSINYFDALDGHGSGATRLMVTPAQHVSDPGATTDTRRQFNSMNFRLYYSNNTTTYGSGTTASTPALSSPPDIVEVQTSLDPDAVHLDVCASVGGATSAGVQDVVATFTDPTVARPSWQSVHLTQQGCPAVGYADSKLSGSDSTSWGGQINIVGSNPANISFLVQAVGGAGLVTLDDNLGKYYSESTMPPASCCGRVLQNIQVTSPPSAPYGSSATVIATLSAGSPGATGAAVPDQPVTFTIGNQSATAVTDVNGLAQAAVPLNLPPGQYTLSAAVNPTDGVLAAAAHAAAQITVTRQQTLLTLTPVTVGSDTSTVATLCATLSTTACGATDPPVASRTVVFELSGPESGITSVQTNSSGQARFDAYGLKPGSYGLSAYFDGAVPGVGTFADSYYAPAPVATARFTTSTSFTTPPTLTLPGNISVPQTNAQGAVVSFVASATDPVDPRPRVSCAPGSVTLFPVGTTTVNCTASDTGGNTATGSFTVTVKAPFTPLGAGTTTCNGTYGGTGADVVVPAGASCTLVPGTTVSDSITVQKGGALATQGVTVANNVSLTNAKPSALCGLTIAHNLSIIGDLAGVAPTVIGDTANGCATGDHVGGSVVISGNAAPVDFSTTTITGDVAVALNTAPVTLNGDQIGRDLVPGGNTGAVVISNDKIGYDLLAGLSRGPLFVTGDQIGHDLDVVADGGTVSVTANQVTHDINVTANSGAITVSGNTAGDDVAVTSNTAAVLVSTNHSGYDLVVSGNRPAGAVVTKNTAGHNATCAGNTPTTGSGNVAGASRTCPA